MARKRTTAEEVAALREAIERLSQEVHVLTTAIDALTDEVQWRNNQHRDRYPAAPPMHITSLPKDPCAKDWPINRVRPEDIPAEPVAKSTSRQPTLFDG